MKMIIEVTTYLMVDVKDADKADDCGGRLSEDVADLCAGFSPHGVHITTGFQLCALDECTWITEEGLKEASQWLDEREYLDRPIASDKATPDSIGVPIEPPQAESGQRRAKDGDPTVA